MREDVVGIGGVRQAAIGENMTSSVAFWHRKSNDKNAIGINGPDFLHIF